VVAYLAISPLNFSLSDWHGESYSFYYLALTLVSFPLSVALWPALLRLHADHDFPYLGGDPTFGRFSTRLAVGFVVLGACAYVQWWVLGPWLTGRVRQWRARRGSKR